MTSLVEINQDRDIAISDVITNTSYEISSLSGAQAKGLVAYAIDASGSSFINNSQGVATTISASSAFRNISNVLFSSTAAGSIPVSHDVASTTSRLRAIQLNRTILDDGLASGSVTATVAFGTTANNIYVDIPEQSVTGSVGRKGNMVDQSSTTNKVGTVYYDYGTVVFHGGDNYPDFLLDSESGFHWNLAGATSDKVVIQSFSFKTQNTTKRASVFCRAFNKEFNYTNNPTAISDAVLGTITSSLTSNPSTYITTVGLYNDDNDLIAVAKTSPPIRKRFDSEITINVQLNY